jgi:hypothetical protein
MTETRRNLRWSLPLKERHLNDATLRLKHALQDMS